VLSAKKRSKNVDNSACYVLIEGRIYEGDIEGKRYHWRKGIPGSKQLSQDLESGKAVSFIYYRTWDKKTKKGKFFYGLGNLEGKISHQQSSGEYVDCFADISHYEAFSIPVIPDEFLRRRVWPGANRQPGIRRIPRSVFEEIAELGKSPDNLSGLMSVISERDVEDLMNGKICPGEIGDAEGCLSAKRVVRTEIYKRSQRIIRSLKRRYKGVCQISGEKLASSQHFGEDVTEAHHIRFLSEGGPDGDAKNLVIVSPEWHRLLHRLEHRFIRDRMVFSFSNGKELHIRLPAHLGE